MYPLLFRPIVKKMIWGSESWEISCRENEMGVVENGEFAGLTFAEVIEKNPRAVLGENFFEKKFPLLVKIIDARDRLSVQIHPNDAYAREKGGADLGKSELWYVLEPPADGDLIIGLKPGVERGDLARAYENGTVEACLNRLPVKRGDIVNIPAGLIHALTAGTVVAEIQQNSDITYRLYDFGRLGADGKPRELHVADALAVVETGINDINSIDTSVIETNYFTVEKLSISAPFSAASENSKFFIFTCVENSAIFETATHSVFVAERRSVFIPAALGAFTIRPAAAHATVLKASPNHIQKNVV